MSRRKQPVLLPPEEPPFVRRIGARTAYVLAPIGLAFGAAQVQGYKMPKPLAVALIGLLLGVAAVALLSIIWECVKEVRRWRERREISTAWIAEEPPGLLDYQPDMKRAVKKFTKQMGRLTDDTGKVSESATSNARWIRLALLLGPSAGQRWANHSARRMRKSALFVAKRTGHLEATIAEFARAQEGWLATLGNAQTDEDRAALAEAQTAAAGRTAETARAIESIEGYRQAMLNFSAQNFSRTLRVAANQVAEQLVEMIRVLRRSLKDSQRLEAILEQKGK